MALKPSPSEKRYGGGFHACILDSVRGGKTPDRKFDSTVGQLFPLLDYGCEPAFRSLVDNFASLTPSCVDRQRECLLLDACHMVCQVTRACAHFF
jgi:hypothetical protein